MDDKNVRYNRIKVIIQVIMFVLVLIILLTIYNVLVADKSNNINNGINNTKNIEEDENMVLNITKENYNEEVLKSDVPVIIDFYADWCGPCKMMSPVIDEIAQEYKDVIKVGKINIDKEESLAIEFGIMSIPTIIIMKNGKISKTFVGVQSKDKIIAEIK